MVRMTDVGDGKCGGGIQGGVGGEDGDAWLCKTNHAFLLCFEGSGSIVMMKTVRWESDDGPVQANATDDE